MRACVVGLALLALSVSPIVADDPPPRLITAGPKISGDGTRAKPFQFPVGSKGKLTFSGPAETVTWLLDDAPAETEVLPGARVVWFPTDSPGHYLLVAAYASPAVAEADSTAPGAAACWFEIVGSGPAPPVPEATLSARTKAALTGPDAKQDAAKLAGMIAAYCEALADPEQVAEMADVQESWKAAFTAAKWTTGRYPELVPLWREVFALFPVGASGPIDPAARASLVESLRVIEQVCEEVARG